MEQLVKPYSRHQVGWLTSHHQECGHGGPHPCRSRALLLLLLLLVAVAVLTCQSAAAAATATCLAKPYSSTVLMVQFVHVL